MNDKKTQARAEMCQGVMLLVRLLSGDRSLYWADAMVWWPRSSPSEDPPNGLTLADGSLENFLAGRYDLASARPRLGTKMAAARKTRKSAKGAMSVNPPYEVASALGDYKTVELTLAIRIAAQVLGEAALQVGALFSADEWAVLAEALKERVIEPENPSPARLMAELVERAHVRHGVGADLAPKALAALVQKVQGLGYIPSWAVLIAVRFRWDYAALLEEGEQWWEQAVRWRHLRPEEAGD